MENYYIGPLLGSGTFGQVFKAMHKTTGEVVAIKQLKKAYACLHECIKLQEVQTLLRLNGHPSIIKTNHFIFEDSRFYFVFEYMKYNLRHIIQQRKKPFTEDVVRHWMRQILQAMEYMHKSGYVHRDMKPENLLVSENSTLKVADLGETRKMVDGVRYTSRVGSLWYRAPEMLLQSGTNHGAFYGAPSDMWAVGAIMAELFTLLPLFRGGSELDQVHWMCAVLGAPNEWSWPDGMEMAKALQLKFPEGRSIPLLNFWLQGASPEAFNLISTLCSWDPKKRPTASSALEHPFFSKVKSKACGTKV